MNNPWTALTILLMENKSKITQLLLCSSQVVAKAVSSGLIRNSVLLTESEFSTLVSSPIRLSAPQNFKFIKSLPIDLQRRLVEDYHITTTLNRTLVFPRPSHASVKAILDRFATYISPPAVLHAKKALTMSFCEGVQRWLTHFVRNGSLLYPIELVSIQAHLDQLDVPSILGAEHLLRLLMMLPTSTTLNPLQQSVLEARRLQLVDFLNEHEDELFCRRDDYIELV